MSSSIVIVVVHLLATISRLGVTEQLEQCDELPALCEITAEL